MKKKVIWISIVAVLLTVAYLASLSDPPLDESEKFVDIESHLTREEMIADIDTLISTFEIIHPNPYRFKSKKSLVTSLDSLKENLSERLTTIQFWRLIDEIILSYSDAHSYAHDTYILTDYVNKGRRFFPMDAKIENEKIIVSENRYGEQIIPEGAEILKINNRSNKEIIQNLTSHSGKETRALDLLEVSGDISFYIWKAYDWDSEFSILYKIKDSEKLDSISVKGINWENRQKAANEKNESFSFKFLNKETGYMKITDFDGGQSEINNFYDDSFSKLREIDAEYLIIDFRGHSGGADSYGEDLAKYIAQEPFRKLSKAYWKITPEFKAAFDRRFIPRSIRWFKPIYLVNEYSAIFYGAAPNEVVTVNYELKEPFTKEKRFKGNVFLITDHNTFSAASIFAEMFKHFKMGEIVGQPTGNLYSFNGFALANFTLPNSKLSYQVSSVYNIANNKEQGSRSVQPNFLLDASQDPLDYILENLIR